MAPLEIIDLHSHYPMQFTAPEGGTRPREDFLDVIAGNVRDVVEAGLLRFARIFFNDPTPSTGPCISLERYREGNVAVAFSVLYSPFDEIPAGFAQRAPSRKGFASLLHQLIDVELEVGRRPRLAMIARSQQDLAQAQGDRKVAIVHCVEGGFHLGRKPREIAQHVAVLRRLGVAYVTLAHLLYRKVATNAAAIPWLSDAWFHALHPQPKRGLTARGKAAVAAMFEHRVLIDVTHMSEASMSDTFRLLDELDPQRRTPVIASHMACRLGHLEYNLTDRWIQAIHARAGVMGVILCKHYTQDGVEQPVETAEGSFEVICKHIDRIHRITGSYDGIAIGSDHDGFIKPTLEGFEHPGKLADLAVRLEQRYGRENAAKICHGNVLRVLRTIW